MKGATLRSEMFISTIYLYMCVTTDLALMVMGNGKVPILREAVVTSGL